MIKVGIKDLKNQLSKYMDQVKKGQLIIVTEYNKIIAEISRPGTNKSANVIDDYLENLAVENRIIMAKRNESYIDNIVCDSGTVEDWQSVYLSVRDDRSE